MSQKEHRTWNQRIYVEALVRLTELREPPEFGGLSSIYTMRMRRLPLSTQTSAVKHLKMSSHVKTNTNRPHCEYGPGRQSGQWL